jgi:hypothetical protein
MFWEGFVVVDAPVVVLIPMYVSLVGDDRGPRRVYQVAGRGRLDCRFTMADS